MTRPRQHVFFIVLTLLLLAASGCRREQSEPPIGTGYVGSNTVNLRDKLAAQQMTVATLKQGDRLEILKRQRKWLHVRTAAGQEGWIEEKHIVTQEIADRFESLRRSAIAKPSQGLAHARRETSLRLEPSRKAAVYNVLKEEESCDVVGRATSERPPRANQTKGTFEMEDWYLLRSKKAAGWGLASNFDMNVPEEVLQYAEGKRVVAWFVLEPGSEPEHPTILWATTSAMGLPYDFDSLRVFVWTLRHKRYETGYIERNLRGYFPILQQKDPAGFSATYENKQGERHTHKFTMEANRVRRGPVL